MDKQPLNTGEQKDMTEFFTDLITKIEEMSQDLVSIHLYIHIIIHTNYIFNALKDSNTNFQIGAGATYY